MRTPTIALVALLTALATASWGCSKGGTNSPCKENQDCKSGLLCCPPNSRGVCTTPASCSSNADAGQPDGGGQDAATPPDAGVDAAAPGDAGTGGDAAVPDGGASGDAAVDAG